MSESHNNRCARPSAWAESIAINCTIISKHGVKSENCMCVEPSCGTLCAVKRIGN